MALPSTFQSSFWNPDLRLPEPLWSKLEAGVVENEEILTFINVSSLLQAVAAIANMLMWLYAGASQLRKGSCASSIRGRRIETQQEWL